MSRVTISLHIEAPREQVFAYVDDHTNTTKYMKDLTRWKPVGSTTHGKGAVFDVAMKAGPTTLESTVEITTWKANQAIGWTSTKGLKQTGAWTFRASAQGCEATFEMEYQLPGGIAGRVLSRAAEPAVRGNLQRSVEALQAQTEKLVAKGGRSTTPVGSTSASAKTKTSHSAAKRQTSKR